MRGYAPHLSMEGVAFRLKKNLNLILKNLILKNLILKNLILKDFIHYYSEFYYFYQLIQTTLKRRKRQ